jgi:hypothetical protein
VTKELQIPTLQWHLFRRNISYISYRLRAIAITVSPTNFIGLDRKDNIFDDLHDEAVLGFDCETGAVKRI